MIDGKDVCFDGDGIGAFSDLIDRTGRLADEVEVMREYANEVWDLSGPDQHPPERYHEGADHCDDDFSAFKSAGRVVRCEFRLYAGTLSWKYSYLFVIALSLGIIAFCLILFKKKKIPVRENITDGISAHGAGDFWTGPTVLSPMCRSTGERRPFM